MNIFTIFPKKTLLLAASLFLILCLLVYFLLKPPPEKKDPQNDQNTIDEKPLPTPIVRTPSFRKSDEIDQAYTIKFDIPQGFIFPESIDSVGVDRNIDSTFIEQLKNRLNINTAPISSSTLLFFQSQDKAKSLTVDSSTGYIKYSVQVSKDASNNISNRKDAVRLAEEFLNSLGVVSITPNTEEVTELITGPSGDLSESFNPKETSLYKVSYRQSYNGIPIYYHFSTPATISVMIDKTGNTRQVEFFNIRPTNKLGAIKIDFEKIKERVVKGEYAIVKADKPQINPPKGGIITISKASLGYFDDKASPNFFPIILLEGVLEPSGKNINLYYSIQSN